ncbi:MAG: hypothetical protein EHM70_09865 [Chloroflexota bacterium]|nr:MAG: hypothetical protein EHM70_09865 [Chloroflexota bacterium]
MLEVRLLGQFEVLHGGKRIAITTRHAQSLFAYLILNAGKTFRREKLAGLLWPDSSEENARGNLRHELWRLRKSLEAGGEGYFIINDLGIAFNPESSFSFDVHRLENASPEGSLAEDLMQAVSSYQGELLPGFYEEWVIVEREHLASLFEARMRRLLEILQSEGRWAELLEWANRWAGQGQWPEPAYRALMAAYANSGDLSKAAATYERFAQGLQKDLGIKPSEQTQALYKRLKSGWKADTQAETPSKPLPDTASPAFSRVQERHHTLRSNTLRPEILHHDRLMHSNLPRPLTSFIGREKEIQQVERLVSRGRLVTITGPGGVGKTRLAIQVAEAMLPRFKDGAWWVELGSLYVAEPPPEHDWGQSRKREPHRAQNGLPGEAHREPAGLDLVAQVVAKALRVQETPGMPLLDGVVERLRERTLLLLLDNCEHLIDACAALVEHLLGDCHGLTILATSREALGVPGEKAWLLPSLSLPGKALLPDIKDIFKSEAVNLFVERAADALPGYHPGERDASAIAQVCLRLDGIPLAIELAAARINMLSAQEIASRLDSRFDLLTAGRRTALPRHKTLRAAIEWSYDLLSRPEKVLFHRLCIFAGSFTLEAAEAICTGDEIDRDDVLPLLGRLVDKSLLNVELAGQDATASTRYRFLDTICSFGRLKVDEAGEIKALRDRHAAYYTGLVEVAEPALVLQNQADWFRRLQDEHDNIRAAIEWSVESDQPESALRMVGVLLWFWWSHGSIHEGLDLARRALDLPSTARLPVYRARALNTAGYLQWSLGDTHSARQSLEEVLSIVETTKDETSRAWSLQFLGLVLTTEGEYDQADIAMKEGVAIARKLGDLNKSSFSLAFRGDIALQKGDRSKARRVYEECAGLLRSLGNKLFLAYPMRRLGYLALDDNDIERAREYFQESLALNREGGDRRAEAACLASIAALALRLGKPVLAARLLGVVESQLESLSINLLFLDQIELGRTSGQLIASLKEEAFSSALWGGWGLGDDQVNELLGEIFRDLSE